jgi:hypothetical protein
MIRLTRSAVGSGKSQGGANRGRRGFAEELADTRARRGTGLIEQLAVPARAVGGFVEMSLETFRATFRRPFQFREFLDQTWMIARVSLIPTLLVAIPFTVLVAFTLNILLREIGAADLSGARWRPQRLRGARCTHSDERHDSGGGQATGDTHFRAPFRLGASSIAACLRPPPIQLFCGCASASASRNDRAHRSTSWTST